MEKKYQCINVVASGHTAVNMSRQTLLQWINDTLGLKIRKVEALCSGAVYCQLMNILFPGCIPLKKIKLEANVMNEYWSNFKQLQIAFRAVGCEKDVPIDRLIQGRFQENFEFLQWFKRFFDANDVEPSVTSAKSRQTKETVSRSSTSKAEARPVAVVTPVLTESRIENLKAQIADYQEKAENVQKQKDFFFKKLRNIELLCTDDEAHKTKKKDFVHKILSELYDTGEETQQIEEW